MAKLALVGIGHNGPPVEVPVVEAPAQPAPWTFETRADLPDDLPRMHYFECDIDALYTALLTMPLEERGFYMTAILAMYHRMEPLPSDDRAGMILTGVTDIRIYRRLKKALIERDRCLLEKASGRISNARFEEEIGNYLTKVKKRREAAKEAALRVALRRVKEAKTNPDAPASQNDMGKDRPLDTPLASTLASMVGGPTSLEKDKQNQRDDTSNDGANLVISNQYSKKETESLSLPLSETDVSDGGGVALSTKPYSQAFETFWRAYPETRGMSKHRAWEAWKRLSPDQRDQAVAAIPALKQQLSERRKKSPDLTCLHAQGYLNQRRFETLLGETQGVEKLWWEYPERVAAAMGKLDEWRGLIAKHANGTWDTKVLGHAPGTPGCIVPPTLVAELRLTEVYTTGGIRRR